MASGAFDAGPSERGKPRAGAPTKPGKPKAGKPAKRAGKPAKGHAKAKAHAKAKKQKQKRKTKRAGAPPPKSSPEPEPVPAAPAEPSTSEPAEESSGTTLVSAVVEAATEAAVQVKVDPIVIEIVQQGVKEDPQARVRVIVFGTGARAALERIGAESIEHVEIVDAESGLVLADEVDVLAVDDGVSQVTLDAPVTSTADGSDGSTATATDPPTTATAAADSATSTTTTASSTSSTTAAVPFPSLSTLYPRVDGAVAAWEAGLAGKGVGIAVIDSGAITAPEFGDRLVQVRLPGQNTALDDSFGHGTFVASVAGGSRADGKYVGVAPGSTIYAINVARGDGVYTSDVVNALGWVVNNHKRTNIRVVNLSLGESVPSSYKTSLLDKVVERVWSSGIVVIVSAGNRGPDTMQYAPANDPFVITVGATYLNGTLTTDDDVLADWSSRGTTSDGFKKPELVAPGRHMVSLLPAGSTLDLMAPDANRVESGYVRMNGTSFAAPQVSAAVALLLEKRPDLSPDQVKWLLTRTGRAVTGSDAPSLDIATALAYSGELGSANEGVEPSKGSAGEAEGRRADFNASAAKEALSWERAAKRLEERTKFQEAAEAWEKAAEAWDKVPVAKRAAEAWERAALLWEKALLWDRAAELHARSALLWETALLWDRAALLWDKAAVAWTLAGDPARARDATWQKSTQWERALLWDKLRWDRASAAAVWDKSASWQSSSTTWD